MPISVQRSWVDGHRLRLQVEVGEELLVFVHAGVGGGEEFVAVEDRVRAGEEAECLGFARKPSAAGTEADFGFR